MGLEFKSKRIHRAPKMSNIHCGWWSWNSSVSKNAKPCYGKLQLPDKWKCFLIHHSGYFLHFAESGLLYTYWDLHTEKLQSKFSFANRCKPIKCRVSLFPHMRKAIRPIRSRVSCTASWSFHSRLVGVVSYTEQAIALRVWREQIVFICISSIVNIESSCLGESNEWKAFRYPQFFGRRVRRKSWKQKHTSLELR